MINLSAWESITRFGIAIGCEERFVPRYAPGQFHPDMPFESAILLQDVLPQEILPGVFHCREQLVPFLPSVEQDAEDVASCPGHEQLTSRSQRGEPLQQHWTPPSPSGEDDEGLLQVDSKFRFVDQQPGKGGAPGPRGGTVDTIATELDTELPLQPRVPPPSVESNRCESTRDVSRKRRVTEWLRASSDRLSWHRLEAFRESSLIILRKDTMVQ
jgi:hypothetical protein